MKHKTRVKPRAFIFVLLMAAVLAWAFTHHTPPLPSPPLKDLAAKHGIELGNYASLKKLNDKAYTDILTSQYSFVTLDGEPNWTFNDGSLRPSPTQFDFTNMDKVVQFAEDNNLPIQAHHLVWGEKKWLPDWLKNGNYTKAQLLDIIHQHIQTVVTHYKGKIKEWTVVNEAFTRGQGEYGLDDWWKDHIGDDSYIDQSFIWAHQADPSAKLILNDFYDERPNPVSDAIYNHVKEMKANGVPIDGVGLQMHIDATYPPSKEDVIKTMQRYGSLGVKVYVTEFDVNLNSLKESAGERAQTQANIYHDMVRACIESKVCVSFAELGITDSETWYNELGWTKSQPLPFDGNYHPKPAFFALRKAFSEN